MKKDTKDILTIGLMKISTTNQRRELTLMKPTNMTIISILTHLTIFMKRCSKTPVEL